MTRVSALELVHFLEHNKLYESLSLLDPVYLYEVLSRIRSAELATFEQSSLALDATNAYEALRLAPELASAWDLNELAQAHAQYRATRTFDDTFLAIVGRDQERLQALVDMEGLDVLEPYLQGRGVPPVLLGMHIGPVYSSVPLLAGMLFPVTVIDRIDIASLIPQALGDFIPPLDVHSIKVPDAGVLVKALGALRRGRVVVVLPDVHNVGTRTSSAPFLGTRLRISTAPFELAKRAGTSSLVYTFRSLGAGRFKLTFRSLGASGEEGVEELVEDYARLVEDEVRARPAEWFGWFLLKELVDA